VKYAHRSRGLLGGGGGGTGEKDDTGHHRCNGGYRRAGKCRGGGRLRNPQDALGGGGQTGFGSPQRRAAAQVKICLDRFLFLFRQVNHGSVAAHAPFLETVEYLGVGDIMPVAIVIGDVKPGLFTDNTDNDTVGDIP